MRSDSDTADHKIADLERELRGTQEMLALVLLEVGEPVTVSKAMMRGGIPQGAAINIDDHQEEDAFVFSVVVPSEQ